MTKEILLPADLELPAAQKIRAGKLTCLYEEGNLRYIGFGQTELVRKIYPAVRKGDWATVPYKTENEIVRIEEDEFFISYTAIYYDQVPIYKAEFIIQGKTDTTITFSMKGSGLSDFKRNRIGLCLLHPLKECRGRTVKVTSADGNIIEAAFPDLVNPALPFVSVNQLAWVTENHVQVALTFEGDIFETEDQRNWSDASYKTYSTRSDLPRPVDVKAGDTIEQKITLKVTGLPEAVPTNAAQAISEKKVAFPQIGYSRPTIGEGQAHTELANRLKKIPFDHYRVIITPAQQGWTEQLQHALVEAKQFNTSIELVVFISDDYSREVQSLIDQLGAQQLLVRSLLVLSGGHNVSSSPMLEFLYPVLKRQLPSVKIGYGTDLVFVDVNENRPGNIPFDFISFGMQPQAHAFDTRSILENLQSQQDIIKTAKSFANEQLVCISPVTFKDRDSGSNERQHSAFIASWTMLALQNLSEAYSITFYELFGPAGILSIAAGHDRQTSVITPSPLFSLLEQIFEFQPVWIIKRFDGDSLLADGLLLENETGDRLFIKVPEVYSAAVGVQ